MNNPHDASDADSSAPTRRSRRRLRAEEQYSDRHTAASGATGAPGPRHTESILQVAANPGKDRPRNPRRGFPLDLHGSKRSQSGGHPQDARPSFLHTMTDSIRMLDPKSAALDARAEAGMGSVSASHTPPRVPPTKPPAATPPRGVRPVVSGSDAATGPEQDFFSPRMSSTPPTVGRPQVGPSSGVPGTHSGSGQHLPPHAAPGQYGTPKQHGAPGAHGASSGQPGDPTGQPGANAGGYGTAAAGAGAPQYFTSSPSLPAASSNPAEDTLDRPPEMDPSVGTASAPSPSTPSPSMTGTGGATPAAAGAGAAPEMSRSELRSAEKDAQEEVTQKAGRNLPLAILMGVVLGGMTLLALLLRPVAFLAIATFSTIWAVWELAFAVAKARIYTPILPLVVSAIGIPVAAFAGGVSALSVAFFLSCIAVVLWSALDDTARGRYDVAGSIFVVSYVPLMMGIIMLMLTSSLGPQKVITYIAVTVASDIGGYAIGRLFGKTPIAPQVSPKKTWEGLAGSMVSSAIVGALLTATLLDQQFWLGAILGAGAAVAATVGDMSQSLIKRDVGVKDMGSGIPGHGGMMERLDSLLIVAPLAYGLFRWWIP